MYHYSHHRGIALASQPVGTLVKAMDVLDALGESAPTGVLELSRRLGMDKSAVSRILTTFKTRGYVHVRENGQYDIGLRLFELGHALQERMPVRDTLIPHVREIARETGETTFAMHYAQGQVTYLYDCVSTQDIRLGERSGWRASPWNHPAGRAILAHREEDVVLADLSAARKQSRAGLPTLDAFRRDMADVRAQGYAEQRDAEKVLISTPILNHVTKRATAALMLGGPAFRISVAQSKSLTTLLRQHCHQISTTLGWISQPFAKELSPLAKSS